MAVYFQPQYKPWWADLANTALKEGLSGLMKGMFERDAAARTKNRYNKEWAQAWDGYGGQPTGAQQQPATMSVESAPEVSGIGQFANPATLQSATGNDALGAALKTQGITVPKEYLPNGNDGLLGTSIKANLANNYVQSQMPSREEFIRRLGMVMSPQNMELALKQADYMMGPRWKVDDQIYKGRALENVLGALPGMQDKEGNRNYNNRAYMYGMDNAANGNLNFLNPEYNRWFTEAENARQRAFTASENQKARQDAWARLRYSTAVQNARAKAALDAKMKLAQMTGASGRTGTGNGTAGLSWSDIEKLNKMVANAIPQIAGKSPEEARNTLRRMYGTAAPLVESQLNSGEKNWDYVGKDDVGAEATLTGANPFYSNPAPVAPASVIGFSGNESDYAPDQGYSTPAYDYDEYWKNRGLGVIPTETGAGTAAAPTIRLPAPQNGQSGATLNFGSPGGPTAATGTIPRNAVEAFMKQTGITDYKTAEAALMRGIQNY